MEKKLLKTIQMASQDQPAWLQKKRSLALMLQEQFPKAEQQQTWLDGWQEDSQVTGEGSPLLEHVGDDYVALPINQAVRSYPELLQENLMEKAARWQDSQLNAAHLALMDTGQFIYVPNDAELNLPLKLGLITKSNNPHTLIIVGAGAKVTVVEENSYGTSQPIYAVTEILMGTNSQVNFYQDNHYQSDHTRQAIHAYQARGSELNIEGMLPESGHGYSSFYSFLDGPNAHWNVQLASFTNKKSQQKVITQVDGYGKGTSAHVNEWGWAATGSQLEWGKLATIDDEPLELYQKRVTASNKDLLINDEQKKTVTFPDAQDFFEQCLPANSWLLSHY